MRVRVLSSGSKGNTTYIETEQAKIIIDMGNSCKYVKEKLGGMDIDPNDIDAILITHTHVDHIKGLKVFLNKYDICVYCTKEMLKDMDYVNNYHFIDSDILEIKDMTINVIKTSHDTPSSVGYVINNGSSSIVYITDTGYINKKYFDLLKNRDVYILESNHDIEMLNNGRYPFNLRQRILSDKGHLSNYDCSKYLANFKGDKTKYILLAHLSEENNTPDIAYRTLVDRFREDDITLPEVVLCKQDEETDVIMV